MTIEFFKANLTSPATLCPAIYKQWKTYFELKAFREINPEFHKINDKAHRRDKIVHIPDPRSTDPNVLTMDIVKVARIAVPMQKLIVSRANAFMTAGPVSFKCKPEGDAETALFKYFNKLWKNTKCDFKNSEIGKALLSETEVAEIWYSRKTGPGAEDFELKCNIFKPSDGYHLIPIFDGTRDLIAFGLGYKRVDEQGKETDYLDIYTAEAIYKYSKERNGEWGAVPSTTEAPNPVKLLYTKIPVIYYSIQKSVWNDVQPMIERLETLLSNFADTNDYNGSPILFAEGTITGMSAKGESGKLIEGQAGAKLSYVSWDHAPESIKLEIEKLVEFIYTCTQTPNLSFEALKGIGKISGVAFDRMMIDAHLKAKDMHTGPYGEGIQRRCNFIVAAASALYKEFKGGGDLDITPEFELFRIDDIADRVNWVQLANGGKPVMSWEDSIAAARLSDDPEATYTELLAQAATEAAVDNTGGTGGSGLLTKGTAVKVVSGKENHPSHAGVKFTINEVKDMAYTLTAPIDTLQGSLIYSAESLAVSNS